MESKRILVVEDDPSYRLMMAEMLRKVDFKVWTAGDGPEALGIIHQQGLPHLAMVDLFLPSMHGFELCAYIKKMGDVPIIIVTGDHSKENAVHGIERFADDYVHKPFHEAELLARVRRVLMRLGDWSYADQPALVIDSSLTIDFANNLITVDGTSSALTPKETLMLSILVRRQGQFVAAESLLARVWPGEEATIETLRVHMSRLRSKLKSVRHGTQYITNERGMGYMFSVPDPSELSEDE